MDFALKLPAQDQITLSGKKSGRSTNILGNPVDENPRISPILKNDMDIHIDRKNWSDFFLKVKKSIHKKKQVIPEFLLLSIYAKYFCYITDLPGETKEYYTIFFAHSFRLS